MCETADDSPALHAPWWVLVQTVTASGLLLTLDETWRVVSLEATAIAVVTGTLAGPVLLGLTVVSGFGTFSDRRQIAIVGAFILGAMGASLFVPREHTPTMTQFLLAAIWSTTLAVLARERVERPNYVRAG